MALPEHIQKDRNELVERVVQDIKEGKPFFWDKGHYGHPPRNASTEKNYLGINNLRLMVSSMKHGYKDSRWLTYKQAQALGGNVKKGEKGTHIEFWDYYKDKMAKNPQTGKLEPVLEPDPQTGKMRRVRVKRDVPLVKCYSVFNAEQVEGMKPEHEITIKDEDRNQHMENMLKNSEAKIYYDQTDRNYYSHVTDEIHVMDRKDFKELEGFYATVAHEIAHSTGSEKRLNRPMLMESDGFGGEKYAQEELRAELTSMFLSQEYGLKLDEAHYQNHAAYLQSWAKALQDDPNELYKAAADAQKAADYIKERMIEKGIKKTVEQAEDKAESKAVTKEAVKAQDKIKTASKETKLTPKQKLQARMNERHFKGREKDKSMAV